MPPLVLSAVLPRRWPRGLRATLIQLLFAGIVIALTGCGAAQSSPTASSPSRPSSSETAPGRPKVDDRTPRTVGFDLTTTDGWHYQGTVPIPQAHVAFTKDVASSPPGSAKIAASLTADPVNAVNFADDNPGRPGGPRLMVNPGYLSYRLPASLGQGGHVLPKQIGPCELGGNTASGYNFEPFSLEVKCPLDAQTKAGTSTDDATEQEVDGMLRYLTAEKPTYVINFDPVQAACNVFIRPDGTTKISSTYDCGPLRLKVNGSASTTPGTSPPPSSASPTATLASASTAAQILSKRQVSAGPPAGSIPGTTIEIQSAALVAAGTATEVRLQFSGTLTPGGTEPTEVYVVCGSIDNAAPTAPYGQGSTQPPWNLGSRSGSWQLQAVLARGCGKAAVIASIPQSGNQGAAPAIVWPLRATAG